MEDSEDNLSSEDIKFEDGPSGVKIKPKKRSLVERELETNLTARVTSPITNTDAASTSRYGRARKLKSEPDAFEPVSRFVKSPKPHQSMNKTQSPVYKMHASNSPSKSQKSEYSLENQIETIYNENISLSRFGSEEKKSQPMSKYSKVYVRKDLIQTKEKDEEIVLIKNMFSPNNNKKSNNLELSSEKYATNKPLNGYTKTPSVVKTLDFDSNKRNKAERSSSSKNELLNVEAKCEYQVGDLAWARMGSYPFWPCIVTKDPSSGMYVRKKLLGRIEREVLHVTFFGDNGRRGWIVDSMLRMFHGKLEFEAARSNFTAEAKKKDPRLYASFFISEKKMGQWQISVEEAEMLLREPTQVRIDILNGMLEKTRSSKVTPKQEKSKRVTRTNSDVSLSESLYDTLFSEEDTKAKHSERSRSKSRNRSLDVSEVVTACLDNMAAKTGITKIQRQSHMDRWLQKAKSKTPEKSHLKSQRDKSSSSKGQTRGTKRNYNFRSSSQELLEDKLPPHQNEHDYSSQTYTTESPTILDDVKNEYEHAELVTPDSIESGSGIGIISKVETLCGKEKLNDSEDLILTVIDNEIFISGAGNINNEICTVNNIDNVQSLNSISGDNNAIMLHDGITDDMETEEENNKNTSEANDNITNEDRNNYIDKENSTDNAINHDCIDVSETSAILHNEHLGSNDSNNESLTCNDDNMETTKMSIDEEVDRSLDINLGNKAEENDAYASNTLNINFEQYVSEEDTNDEINDNDLTQNINDEVNDNNEHDDVSDTTSKISSDITNSQCKSTDNVTIETNNLLPKEQTVNNLFSKETNTDNIILDEHDVNKNNNPCASGDNLAITDTESNIDNKAAVTEIASVPNKNHFFELGTIDSHVRKKESTISIVLSPENREKPKKPHKYKLSLNKSMEGNCGGEYNDPDSGIIISVILNGDCDHRGPNMLDNEENESSTKEISTFMEQCSGVNMDVVESNEASTKKNKDMLSEDHKEEIVTMSEVNESVERDMSCKSKNLDINEQENSNRVPLENSSHDDTLSMDTDKMSLYSEPIVVNGYHDDNFDVDTTSIEDETLADYQTKLKSIKSEKNAKMLDLDKLDKLIELDTDNMSVKSEDSETSTGRRRRKDKLIEKRKVLDDPEFLKYLELRQDALMDENPELSETEITNYLYNTWLYEEGLKTDAKKADDIDQSNLVKGINQEAAPVKKIRKKIKVDKEKETEIKLNIEKDLTPKEKSKRRIIRQYYKEDFSDFDDDIIEYYSIFKPKPKLPKTTETTEVNTENFETEIVSEVAVEVDEFVSEETDQVEAYFRQLTAPKPNLFKGLIREKVCEICEKFGNLVKCKSCYSMYHIDCVNKVTEIVEVPNSIRGRKKKKRNRGRKAKEGCMDTGSQSDEKSQDANNSEEMHNVSIDNEEECHITANEEEFESKLSAKMKELLENLENLEYDSCSNDEHNFSDTNYGECKIVDVTAKKKEANDYSDFKCNNCQKNNIPVCFVCKSPISPKEKMEHRQKCTVAHCNKYYHMECLDHWPQTQFNGGEVSRNNKEKNFEAFSCPRHVCHTCVCDDPRGCKTRFSGDKLARCVRCPATYHTFTKCLPAGSQILSGSHIICPRHYEHRPGKVPCHVNTGWCFICALGGSLICCEYCPTSFHAECLNIKPPDGGYMCEDCETGRLPLYGEMVWVKLGHYRWWPGIILHPSEVPHNILSVKHSPGEFVVRFLGQYDHYWVNRGRVFPFQEGDSGKVSSQKSKIDAAFTMAMEHAQRACGILKAAQPNEEESDIASSLLPPHYVKLKVNKPCGSLCGRKVDLEEGSLTQCECDPNDVEPCGPYSQCLNRMLLTECGPMCRAGDKCNNRAFEKRQYPKLTPYRTPHRGWGLKTLVNIKAGQFVIEYVGELIDEEEFQRRMSRKHEVRDENFYFLTLDKERVIDAGPKGNFARFMNHSCEPNCETQKWTVLGDIRVGLFTLYDIPANSELTFNYNLESAGIEKKRCMCGAKRCSGYIGAKPKQDEQPKKNKLPKRTYKRRKHREESPSTSQKPKNRIGRPYKPRELTEIEKDLLIIKNATNAFSSDSECSGRLSSLDSMKDNRNIKRRKIFDEILPKRIKMEAE